jgi:AraC family transcriptional regulator
MYSGIQKIEEIIDYIENHLTSEIDYEELALRMTLSVYEFRRIFSFIVGVPISEYIRKRKLSLAACDIITNPRASIHEISKKYGYSTLASFSKAFNEYHGFSPTVCQKESPEILLFPRPKFEWTVKSTEKLSFQIVNDVAFGIKGYCAYSDQTDTCCCEEVWNDFYESGSDKALSGDTLYVSYHNEQGKVKCYIGERISAADALPCTDVIPKCQWLTVKMNTTDDEIVNKKYNVILYDILPSTRLKRRIDLPTVEVFPLDMTEENFEWEIRIPIEKE